MVKKLLLSLLMLFVGVSMQAQTASDNQMDERFNDNKMPYGWFAEGWKVDSTGVVKKGGGGGFDISTLMGGGDDGYNYLMTPPLSVESGEVLTFSARKGKDSGFSMSMESDSSFVLERAVYGEHRWLKVADFTTQIDSTFKTFTVANTPAGEYRFRFRAGATVEIDSVAGMYFDSQAPDIYPVYNDKNIQPVDLSLCEKDTTVTFSVINTGTGTLKVALSLSGEAPFSIDQQQLEVAAADTAKVKLTFSLEQAREGRNSTMLSFKSEGRVEEIILPIDAVKTQEGVYVEDFNKSEMPKGWFAEGWVMKENTVSVAKKPEDMGPIVSSNETFTLMAPPMTVNGENEVLLLSARKPGDGGGFNMGSMFGGSDESKFVVEKSVYGSNKWEKVKEFVNAIDTLNTVLWISNIEPGDYRFRFVASDSIVIDSVAGYHFIDNAPDLYVQVDSAQIRDYDFGLLTGDTLKTYNVINTGTGDFSVNVFPSDPRYISLDNSSVSLKAGESAPVNATIRNYEEAEGEVMAAVIFMPTDQKIAMQTGGIHAYIIPKDSWQESFEPEYVVEDKTFPRPFPEGWISTGWEIKQSEGDMMSMFGGDSGPKPYVASSSSNEYELITPRLQAKQGQILKFNAQAGGMGMMMAMFGADMGAPQYLSVYYKRDYDNDWTLYNMYFTGGDVFFKAPYTGYYQLKFVGGGSSVDEFIGFKIAQEQTVLTDGADLSALSDGKVNVVADRELSAQANADGSWTPMAHTVAIPFDMDINEYYEPGKMKLYQLEYVDSIYTQIFFKEVEEGIKAGEAYLAVVNSGTVHLYGIDANVSSDTKASPIYDMTAYYLTNNQEKIGSWNPAFSSMIDFSTLGEPFAMNADGTWARTSEVPAFSAFMTLDNEYWNNVAKESFGSNAVSSRAKEKNGEICFDTKLTRTDENGNREDVEIPGLLYNAECTTRGITGIAPSIVTVDKDGTRNYFDMQGRRLNGKPEKGIYIENGKKYIAR